MQTIKKETVLSLFLGFVVIWFGVNELMDPESWLMLVPEFLDLGESTVYLVMGHGAILVLSGIALVFNWKRRLAATVIFLMILAIVIILMWGRGLHPTAVRDIGLLGIALALALKN